MLKLAASRNLKKPRPPALLPKRLRELNLQLRKLKELAWLPKKLRELA